ncbi:hypothetical protein [Mycobacterium sp. 3519A]|uniref:DUF7159 family protein n=1 Tax=Mycobacterium sp. 3519A TaxID=2057184 RepID=UPI001F2F051B|nr:hypothetical protein [Mycobacterium sp. 3519A]
MDIVLGVSMTPTTVRMVLVEGEKADGAIVDHDAFDVAAVDGSATSANAAEQVVEAILGTKESAAAGGHHLKSIGVTWSDHAEASTLRDTLAARGIDDVMLVSDGHAAGALAQAVGRAVGYATTALLFIDRDTATLSVVQTEDGSIVKVLSRSLHSGDAMAVLADMAAAVDAQDSPPQGMFVVGSGVDVSAVKAHLEHLVSIPVSAPDDADVALARGAALASAHAPALEASTVGLAYSQDPDGTTAGNAYTALAAAETQMAPLDADARTDLEEVAPEEGRKPFLLVGSALTSIFVIGVVALVISLAVSIRPTVDQRPDPGPNAIAPTKVAPPAAPAPVQARPDRRGRRWERCYCRGPGTPARGWTGTRPRADSPRAPQGRPPPPHRPRCRRHNSPSRRRHPRPRPRPSSRRCRSPCRKRPRPSRRRVRCSSSRRPPRRRRRPHRPHRRPLPRRRPRRLLWRPRRFRTSRRRCTTRPSTTRTSRRPRTTHGPNRRGVRRGSTTSRTIRSHPGTEATTRAPVAEAITPATVADTPAADTRAPAAVTAVADPAAS